MIAERQKLEKAVLHPEDHRPPDPARDHRAIGGTSAALGERALLQSGVRTVAGLPTTSATCASKASSKPNAKGPTSTTHSKLKEVSQIVEIIEHCPATCDFGVAFWRLNMKIQSLEYSWPFRVSRFEFPVGRKIV